MTGIWDWPESVRAAETGREPDFSGYKVVANDGEIGHVRSFESAPDASHLIVDTGGWLLGKLSVIPAGAVRVVAHDSKTVQIDLTKQQIKDAPEYSPGAGYGGYREPGDRYFGGLFR